MRIGAAQILVVGALTLAAACGPTVPAQVVAWRPTDPVIEPPTDEDAAVGGLLVETDTDPTPNGGETFYNLRRPYDIYSESGTLVRHVDNQGARGGEEPVLTRLAPGTYVVASVVGTVYRRVEVQVKNGRVTRVAEGVLRGAPAVFASSR